MSRFTFQIRFFKSRDARFSCFPADDDRPYFNGSMKSPILFKCKY